MYGKVHLSEHACTNDCLRCTECEVHDIVHKHNIRCTKKRVPRFITLEALYTLGRTKISVVSCKNVITLLVFHNYHPSLKQMKQHQNIWQFVHCTAQKTFLFPNFLKRWSFQKNIGLFWHVRAVIVHNNTYHLEYSDFQNRKSVTSNIFLVFQRSCYYL